MYHRGVTALVMRHARAVPEDGGRADAERHLSVEGRDEARRTAAWLQAQPFAPARIVTSPVARAVQTAEIVAAVLGIARVEVLRALATPGGSPRAVADWLNAQADTVLAIGHEPDISGVVAYLIGDAGYPVLAPAQLVAVAAGRIVATSPAFTSPTGAPPSTPGWRSPA